MICVAVALGSTALSASAADASDEPCSKNSVNYVVGYSDLDLSKIKDVTLLYLRLSHAATTLCESAATWGKKEGRACVNKAMAEAVARAHSVPHPSLDG